jgi:homoaconitase/3-isopropylmalate dehydratase large subunit
MGFALPGSLILGSDSHTTAYGALGAFSAGVGRSEMAALYATSKIWLKTPASFKVEVKGKLEEPVTSKDLVLKIIGDIGADGALYKSVEFAGPAIEAMSLSSRLVLSNMAVEMGAKNGYCAPDKKTFAFLEGRAVAEYTPIYPDPDAEYERVLSYDASNLGPQVAKPHTVDNVAPVEEGERRSIRRCLAPARTVDSRTCARRRATLRARRSPRSADDRSWSQEILLEALRAGLIEIFVRAGAMVLNPGAGRASAHTRACWRRARCASRPRTETSRAAWARTKRRRTRKPATVAASAVSGVITDPRKVSAEVAHDRRQGLEVRRRREHRRDLRRQVHVRR